MNVRGNIAKGFVATRDRATAPWFSVHSRGTICLAIIAMAA
jgi:hypothetical protein